MQDYGEDEKIDPFQNTGYSDDQKVMDDEIASNGSEKPQSESDEVNAPKDYCGLLFFLFLLQGVAVLFPFNAFVSAPGYFFSIYGQNALLYMTICYGFPNFIGLLVWIVFGKQVSVPLKVVPGYLYMGVVLFLVPVFALTGVAPQMSGFVLTLLMMQITGYATSGSQGGIFGYAAQLPPRYMTAIMSGNGVAGFTVSILRIITKLAIERHNTQIEQLWSVIVFFIIAGIVLVFSTIGFGVMWQHPVSKFWIRRASGQSDVEPEATNIQEFNEDEEIEKPALPQVSFLAIMKKIWLDCIVIYSCYAVTLAIFPGICTLIPSSWGMGEWLPIAQVTTFNLFDMIGRTAPVISKRVNKIVYKLIHIPMFLRVIFFPLFIMCWKQFIFFKYDIFGLLFMAVMAFTNGFYSTVVMSLTPTKVKPHEMGMAGTIMTTCLVLGILTGTNLSLAIVSVMNKIIPPPEM